MFFLAALCLREVQKPNRKWIRFLESDWVQILAKYPMRHWLIVIAQ